MTCCYLGIDLTGTEARASAWAALDGAARLAGMGAARRNDEIIALAQRLRPESIAIDAPLFLPSGMSSLENPVAGLPTGRACERALKKQGIGCFYTTPRSIIKGMVYRGIRLRRELDERGFVVLEVFPYATKVRLFGPRLPKKTHPAGRAWLQEALSRLLPSLAGQPALSHDQLDALVCAYTALLHGRGQAEGLGDPDEGLLWLPTFRH